MVLVTLEIIQKVEIKKYLAETDQVSIMRMPRVFNLIEVLKSVTAFTTSSAPSL